MDTHLEQIQKMQLILQKYDIHLFPLGFENSQEKIKELIQMIDDDQGFNDNLQIEVNKFLSLDPRQFKQILDYDSNIQISKEYDEKLLEYNKFQEKIKKAQNKIKKSQKDITHFQAYIHNNLIRDHDRIKILEDVYDQLNQMRAQAIKEIQNLDKRSTVEAEMKAYRRPTQAETKLTEILVILCNNKATLNNLWAQFRHLVENFQEFLTKLIQFKIEDMSQNSLRIARTIFEGLSEDQLRYSDCRYALYKWSQYQFQILDIISTYQTGIEELQRHKKALKYKEKIKEIKLKLSNQDEKIRELQTFQKPQMLEKEVQAIKVMATVKWFDLLQVIVKPQQYGIKITNFLIKFLSQQCSKTQIDSLIDEIFTNIFVNYTILYDETPQQPYKYPIIINNLITQNTNYDTLASQILILVRNPLQFYHNLKQLNCLIDQATLLEEIHSLIHQIYLNEMKYSNQFLSEILKFIHQFIIMFPNKLEFTVHQILKILNVNSTERKALLSIIKHIQIKSQISLQLDEQLKFQGSSIIDYLIKSFLEDNQNKNKLIFSEQQIEAIKDIILREQLNVDETIENILENYQIILKSKEFYNEVIQNIRILNKEIETMKFKIQDNKEQIVFQKNQFQEYVQFQNQLKFPYLDLLNEKKCLEDILLVLIDKDLIIKEQIDKLKKILNRPIHYGIKNYELAFFKSLSKFNPISYFASKITLIQLGIHTFTPDMIKKHLGSQRSIKKLKNLTINNLTMDQYNYLQKLLLEFDQNNSLLKSQSKAIQNMIKKPYRIFYFPKLLQNKNSLFVQRTDLLQKQRVIQNKLNVINQMIKDLDQQVISGLESRINQIIKEIEIREDADNQTTSYVDQFKEIQQLQEFIIEIEQFDNVNLCIKLISLSFTNIQSEVQINKQFEQHQLNLLTQWKYQQIPKEQFQLQSKFYLLVMYLQVQYKNIQVELKNIYDNIAIFNQFKQPVVEDALSYWNYYHKIAKTNINILIGICCYQLFYKDFGHLVQAICIQPEHFLIENQSNINYQIRVLYEILHIKYDSFTLSVILQFLKQVINIQQKINNIYDILNYQINIDEQSQIEFKEFQLEVQGILNFQIKEFII